MFLFPEFHIQSVTVLCEIHQNFDLCALLHVVIFGRKIWKVASVCLPVKAPFIQSEHTYILEVNVTLIFLLYAYAHVNTLQQFHLCY